MARRHNLDHVETPPSLRSGDDVGYGRPPSGSRFQPGQSGNPLGRPRGSKNAKPALNEERLKSIILEEAYRTIPLTENGRAITMPIAQAVMRAVAVSAVKGRQRSQRLFTDLLTSTERANKALHDEYVSNLLELKARGNKELARRRRYDIDGPDLIPHPDHIVADQRAGTVLILGPMTREQKVGWDRMHAVRQACEATIIELRALLADEADERLRRGILRDLRRELAIVASIDKSIGDYGRDADLSAPAQTSDLAPPKSR